MPGQTTLESLRTSLGDTNLVFHPIDEVQARAICALSAATLGILDSMIPNAATTEQETTLTELRAGLRAKQEVFQHNCDLAEIAREVENYRHFLVGYGKRIGLRFGVREAATRAATDYLYRYGWNIPGLKAIFAKAEAMIEKYQFGAPWGIPLNIASGLDDDLAITHTAAGSVISLEWKLGYMSGDHEYPWRATRVFVNGEKILELERGGGNTAEFTVTGDPTQVRVEVDLNSDNTIFNELEIALFVPGSA